MSVLANQTNATPGDAFFWRVNASTITANSFSSDRVLTNTLSTGSLTVGNISTTGSIIVDGDITAQNITATDTLASYFANFEYATTQQGANIGGLLITSNIAGYNTIFYPQAVISTISTSHIILDGNQLDTGGAGIGAVLLLNGIPIATTSTSISSLVEWSIYPAISTVILDNNNIAEVNNIQTQTFNAFDATIANQLTVGQTLFGNISEFQQVITDEIDSQNLVSLTGSISSLTVSTLNTNSILSPTGNFTNLTATNATINNLGATNINVVAGTITDFQAQTANISQVNATNETVSGTLTVNEVRGVNGFINAEAANRIRIRVQGSSDVFSSPELDLEAGGGNRGIVKLIANPGSGGVQGEVTVTAKGGSAAGYATGGLLNLTAERGTAVLGTLNTSRVGIAADSVTSYAGGPTPFAGLLGYNFIYGLLGVNIVAATPPTLPNVPGTVYLYGLNPLGFGSSGGVRVQNGMSIDYITPYPQGFIEPQYDLIIKGNPAGQMVTLSNVRVVSGSNALLTGFQDVNTVNLSGTNLNGTNIFGSNITGSNVNGLVGNISTLNSQNAQITQLYNVSSINGASYPPFVPTQSTFNQLFTSSLQAQNITTITANITQISGVSTLNGYTVEQLISSVSPLVYFSTVSSFQQLYTSSLQANTISTNTANVTQLTGVSTLNGYTVEQLISSVSPLVYFSTISTFQEIYTSSLYTSTIIGSDQFLITAPSSMNFSQSGTGSGLSINTSGNLVQLNSQVGLYLNAQGIININSGTYEGGTNINLQSDSEGAITFQTPSTICTGDITAATFNGLPLPTGTAGISTVSTFQELFTSSFVANTISTQTLTANQISSGSVVASTFNGYTIQQLLNPAVQSTFQTLFASTATIFELFASTGTIFNASNLVLQVSSINGFNTNQFLSTTGIPPQVSTFQQLFTSSLQANSISSGTLAVSSLNGYNINQLINTPQLSTFSQLYTSSLQATSISSGSASLYSITGVSTINGFTVSEFVSSAAPPVPQLSTFFQLFTSSLQANVITPYQTSDLTVAVPGTLIENAGNYNLTVASNIDINSSNAISIYTTNTAPPVASDGIYILGQGDTTIGSQTNTNITAANNILVNAGATTNVQGFNVGVSASQQIQINSSNSIVANTSSINLNGSLVINGQPYVPGGDVSSFTTLYANTIQNNTSPTLRLQSQTATISTGFGLTIESQEILAYSRSVTDFFALTGIALSTNAISLDAPTTTIGRALNAPQIFTSSINGLPYGASSFTTLATNILTNNTSPTLRLQSTEANISTGFGLTIESQEILAYSRSLIDFFALSGIALSTNAISLDAPTTTIGRALNAPQIFTSSINGLPYVAGGGTTVSTFQQLFTSSFVVNTINGAAYPPPATTVSTFQQLFTSSFVVNTINGQPYVPGGGSGVSTYTTLYTTTLSNNPVNPNLTIDAAGELTFETTDTTINAASNIGLYTLNTDIDLQAGNSINLLTLNSNILIYATQETIPPPTDALGVYIRAQSNIVIVADRNLQLTGPSSININTSSLTIFSPSTICAGDLNVQTINGLPPGTGGGGTTVSTFQQLFTSSILTNSGTFQNIYMTGGGADIRASQNLSIIVTDGLSLTGNTLSLGGTQGTALLSFSNDITIQPGIISPGQIVMKGTTNLSNNNIINVNSLTATTISTTNLSINGQPYSPGVSTFTNLYTSNLFVTASTITSNLVVLNRIFNPNPTQQLEVQAADTLNLIGNKGMILGTGSNDIILTAGLLDPGAQNVTLAFCDLNLSNNSINNVDVLTSGNIITTNTTTTNLYATQGSISSLTVSTINTYPVHKAFGSAWATTDPAALALLAGIVNYVDIPTRQAFNFVPDTTGNVFSLFPSSYPLNRGIYQLNARCTFSNGDSNLATVSSWIDTVPNVSTTATAISRCVIQIEPNRLGTTYMTCQSLVDEFISVNCFTTSDNITLYYDAGDGVNTPPSYAMNLTAHQLYQYENAFEEYNWPPNPIPPPPPPP